jgi:CheY-like chemotaxis protein
MNRTVLVVDDEEDVREALRDLLEQFGYKVLAAPNGREALEILHGENRPGFVLLDLIMPVMNGWEFLEAVAQDAELSRIPVSISTSAPEQAPSDRDVIPKPIDIDALLERVRAACDSVDGKAKER